MNTILIIDDDSRIRDILKELLELFGYDVLEAENGIDGIDVATNSQPKLILCDVEMPGTNGFEVAKTLRQNTKTELTPIIFLSGYSSAEDLAHGLRVGGDDYITKPFKNEELKYRIDRQLLKHEKLKLFINSEYQKKLETAVLKANTRNKLLNESLYESIKAASNIQKKLLPSTDFINSLLPFNFLLNLPKDTVSGDSIWVKRIKGKTLIAVMDCTGHGVPGAMINMICQCKLDAAVEEYGLTQPSEILDKVNELVVGFLGKGKGDTFGMDINICSIDRSKKVVTTSGARRPLYLIKSKNSPQLSTSQTILLRNQGSDRYFYEIKGNIFGIGTKTITSQFSDTTFKYIPGDTIYLSSDGFADQFGGQFGKKFLSSHLRKLLFSIQDLGIENQKAYIHNVLEMWLGDQDQTDDILIFGIQLD